MTNPAGKTGLIAAVWLALCVGRAATAGVWPDISQAPEGTGIGERDVALIVGIEDYWQLPDIPGAAQNARDWFAFLTSTLGIKPARATMLLNDDATLEEIRKVAAERAADAHPDGIFWLIFIGHGTPGREGAEGLLVGADAKASASSLYERSIPQSDLLETVEAGGQARTVVILDTCFSGRSPAGDPLVPGLQPVLLSGSWEPERSTILTAAKGDQFAGPLPGMDRPAFSYLMLGAMRGWGDADGDGRVTVKEALYHTKDTLAAVLRDRRQEPDGFGAGAGATLSRASEEGPDIAGIVLALADGGSDRASPPREDSPTRFEPARSEPDVDQLRKQRLEKEAERREESRSESVEEAMEGEVPPVQAMDAVDVVEADVPEWEAELEELSADLVQRSEIEWYALEPLRAEGGEIGLRAVQGFLDRYRDATVEVGGAEHAVEIPLVELAEGWLDLAEQRSAAEAASPQGPVIRFDPAKADAPATRDDYLSDYGCSMVRAPRGHFLMGSPGGEEGRGEGETQHRVDLSHPFVIGATEVTQALWEAVMGSNPAAERERYWSGQARGSCAEYKGTNLVDDDLPVHCIDWYDAVEFCNRLSELEGLRPAYEIDGKQVTWDMNANGYRLPTEAEWEYAARANDDYVYSGADEPEDVAWYRETSDQRSHRVGSRDANGVGIRDMSGNIAEWTWDWYADHGTAREVDPTGPESGSERTRRGGSFNSDAASVRVAARSRVGPSHRGVGLGLRIARNAR